MCRAVLGEIDKISGNMQQKVEKYLLKRQKKNEEQVDACYVEPRVNEKSRENRMEKINTVENCVWA